MLLIIYQGLIHHCRLGYIFLYSLSEHKEHKNHVHIERLLCSMNPRNMCQVCQSTSLYIYDVFQGLSYSQDILSCTSIQIVGTNHKSPRYIKVLQYIFQHLQDISFSCSPHSLHIQLCDSSQQQSLTLVSSLLWMCTTRL